VKAKSGIPQSRTRGKYRSKFERTIALYLKDKGIKFKYEETKFDYVVQGRNWIVCPTCGPIRGQIVRKYTPDFELPNEVFIETKGRFLAKDRNKMIAVKKQHPDLDVRLLFLSDNVIKELKVPIRYSEWAEKNGFHWAVKDIPASWLKPKKVKRPSWREALGDDSTK
jgi:hypothetical protein